MPGLKTLNVAVEEIFLSKPSEIMFQDHLAKIFSKENLKIITNFDENMKKFPSKFKFDLRMCTNYLQFWSGLSENFQFTNIFPSQFRNLARIVDGLSDKRNFSDETESKLDFKNNLLKNCLTLFPIENADKNKCQEEIINNVVDVQLKVLRETLSLCSPREAFCEKDLILDYTPYLRQIASVSRRRSEESRRFRHYLYNIGLDDRSKSLQSVFEKSAF